MANPERTPEEIAEQNHSAGFDSLGDFGGLAESLGAHRENVGDTVHEMYGDFDKRSLHEALLEYDRLVEETFDRMHKAAMKMPGEVGNLFKTLMENEKRAYDDVFKEKYRFAYELDNLETNPGTPGRKLKNKLLR